jgi:hypothetical protein
MVTGTVPAVCDCTAGLPCCCFTFVNEEGVGFLFVGVALCPHRGLILLCDGKLVTQCFVMRTSMVCFWT